MMFYDFMRKILMEQSDGNFVDAFHDQAPSKRTVERWYLDFRRERTSLQDETRSERPSPAVSPQTIAAAETLLREDSRINYEQFAENLKIGKAAINTILHDYLRVRRLAAQWIPRTLSEMQLEERVEWCKFMLKHGSICTIRKQCDNLQSGCFLRRSPCLSSRARSVEKKMVASFLCKTGQVAITPLEDRCTANADWCINDCLHKAFEAFSSRRPKTSIRGLLLHYDNASAHTAAKTLDFLAENSVQLVSHPLYSPDLAPWGFSLSPTVKEKIHGIRFENPEEALSALLEEKWHNCFDSWFHRMHFA
ncbi:Histone-lysine N-methyltransferase SETMAR-like [Oopsacas minuta]|uniref:Histone-lysine N-methyltransferase SETMAR-like n=1 Tax=Oopsacas minuta TaxID=111878 RepID=A0AAV7JGD8_9METZ|nr:Histone-lysine N-methyltransferase SETMAR-like [Oopsacas minuta]